MYEEGLKVKSVMLEQQRIALFNQQKALERREEDAERRETALNALRAILTKSGMIYRLGKKNCVRGTLERLNWTN